MMSGKAVRAEESNVCALAEVVGLICMADVTSAVARLAMPIIASTPLIASLWADLDAQVVQGSGGVLLPTKVIVH